MSDAQQADSPLSQKVQDLDRQIAAKVEALVKGIHSQIGERVRAATDDVVRWIDENALDVPKSLLAESDLSQWLSPAETADTKKEAPSAPVVQSVGFQPLLEAISRIDAEVGQAEILGGLLEESLRFASRSAFFLIRQGQVRGWSGQGFGESDQRTRDIEEKADQDPWGEVIEKSSALICSDEQLAGMAIRLNASPGEKAVLVPFAIRGQVAGVMYCDQIEGETPLSVSGLQLLTYAATSALETAGVSPGLSPCLKLEGDPYEPVAEVEAAQVTESAEALPVADEEPVAEEPSEEEATGEVEAVSTQTAAVAEVVDEVASEEVASEEVASEEDLEGELSKEDLETTVVPAVSDETDTGQAPEQIDAGSPVTELPIGEPTVEIDAPALAIGSVEPEPPAVVPEPAPVAEEAPEAPVAPSFDTVTAPSDEEIAQEVEPEPELEDTNAWELEEEEEDDEPTQVGMAVKLEPEPEPVSPPALEISTSEPEAAETPEPDPVPPAPSFDSMPVGQETVRLPVVTPPVSDPGDETSPGLVSPPSEPAAPEQPVVPAAPSFADAPTPVVPAAPTSFADPVPPAAPSSFVDPVPSVAAPTSFADPVPPVAAAPTAPSSFADPVPPAAPAAPTFAAPETPAEPKPPASGSQVQPPSDLEGPGLAFANPPAAAEQPDTASEALHEEARRLARLLVSEIKLYNEEIIEEGRRTGNIYERLKDDIDRSRQMYEERIDPRLADQEDYFHQELVQRLAGGDASLLGMTP